MIIDTNSGAMNVASELNVWLTVRRVAAVSGGPSTSTYGFSAT